MAMSSGTGGLRDPALSLVSIGWGSSLGQRSEGGSGTGLNTMLTPPPVTHGSGRGRGNGSGNGSGSGNGNGNGGGGGASYPKGSLGIGKAF
jgi:hypothetical protein